ncbi:MAG: acyl-CoA thioesterase [Bacteroidetes bacterium]|nr:acyl-CoA thioesterase [Bacteroidota bacterium]
MFADHNAHIVLKIDWSDLDLFGHVNNVAFFKYIQSARVNYCESIGLTSINEKNKLGFIVASTNCTFKIPLRYPGDVKVFSKIEWIKNSSFQLLHVIVNDNNEVIAESIDIVVVFDYEKKIKTNITPELKAKMEAQENKKLSAG